MNHDQATRRIEWLVTRYLYPTPEREARCTTANPYEDHQDQLVTTNPYTR